MMYIKILSELIFLLYFVVYINCSKIQSTSEKCIKYIKNLNIICLKFDKDETYTPVCKKWEPSNTSAIFEIPIECENKEYNLDILIKNSNSKEIIKCNIFIQKENLLNGIKEVEKIMKQKMDILKCMKYLMKYLQNIIDEKNKSLKFKQCKEWKEKQTQYNFNLCVNKIEFIENIFYPNGKLKFKNILYKVFNKLNNEINCDEEKIEERKGNSFFINKEGNDYNIKKDLMESNKDCIEYGLDPLNEDIIVCTKYE